MVNLVLGGLYMLKTLGCAVLTLDPEDSFCSGLAHINTTLLKKMFHSQLQKSLFFT